MDEKTLKYMGDRVDRARILRDEIKKCQYRIDDMNRDGVSGVSITNSKGYGSSITGFNTKINDYVVAMIKDITSDIVNRLEQLKQVLQDELDEL